MAENQGVPTKPTKEAEIPKTNDIMEFIRNVTALNEKSNKQLDMLGVLRGVSQLPETQVPSNDIPNAGVSRATVKAPTPTPNLMGGTGIDQSGYKPADTGYGRIIEGAQLNQFPTSPEQAKEIARAEYLQGTPEQKVLAALELKELSTPDKISASGYEAANPLLTPELLSLAVSAVEKNPAAIANYPVKQKSQISGELERLGKRVLSSAQYRKIQEAQASANKTKETISLLEGAFNKTSPVASQFDTWKKYPEKYATQLSRFNNDLVAYDSLVKGSVGNLARSLFGEAGVLTDQDLLRVKAALPDATKTNSELAKTQFDYLRKLNAAIAKGTISAYDYKTKEKLIDDIVGDLEGIKSSVSPKTAEAKPTVQPREGDTKMSIDGHKQVYVNGKWVNKK